MAILLDGKKISQKVLEELKPDIAKINERLYPNKLRLDIVMVGDHAPSITFVKRKQEIGVNIDVRVKIHHFANGVPLSEVTEQNISNGELEKALHRICKNKLVHGALVQLPVPKHINEQSILNIIPESKDVDVLGKEASGKFYTETELILPSTLAGTLRLLQEYGINDFVGKNIVVVGAGKLVGKPAVNYFMRRGVSASAFNIRSRTAEKEHYLKTADIIISGTGVPLLITGDMVKDGVIIVDAGTSKDPKTGKLVGDIDFESVAPKASYITPVPGGVGPMTVAMIFYNLVQLAKQKLKVK